MTKDLILQALIKNTGEKKVCNALKEIDSAYREIRILDVLMAFNIAGYPEDAAETEAEIIVDSAQ